jgi:hypothetical protein
VLLSVILVYRRIVSADFCANFAAFFMLTKQQELP